MRWNWGATVELEGSFFDAFEDAVGAAVAHVGKDALIQEKAYFLQILYLSAPVVSIINMVTSYFQAFGKALCSLIITVLRNVALFIPAVVVLNHYWQLSGVIDAKLLAEVVLIIV